MVIHISGVHSVLVSLMAEKAEVKYDAAYIMPSQIANTLTELGFPSKVIDNENVGDGIVEIKVMDCYSV